MKVAYDATQESPMTRLMTLAEDGGFELSRPWMRGR